MTSLLRTDIGLVLFSLIISLRAYGQSGNDSSFSNSISDLLRKDSVAGGTGIVVYENNGSSINYFYNGLADHAKTVNDSSIFNIGSCSKIYIATLVLMLQEEGKIDIDDPINKYLAVKGLTIKESVTVRSLLNHTSGLPDYTTPDSYIRALLNPKEIFTSKEILKFVNKRKSCKQQGVYCYNNFGYFLLGWLIEDVTQLPLEAALRHYIFDKLRLRKTFFYFPKQSDNVARPGYEILYPNEPRINCINLNNLTFAAGNIYTNAYELDLFIRKLFIERTLLQDSSLNQMLNPIRIYERNNYSIGLGVYTSNVKDRYMISHTGRLLMGYTSLYACFPELNYSVVIMRNNIILDYDNRSDLLNSILLKLLNRRIEQ